jgi:hypothetical protein
MESLKVEERAEQPWKSGRVTACMDEGWIPRLPMVARKRHPWPDIWLTEYTPTPLFFGCVANKGVSFFEMGCKSFGCHTCEGVCKCGK